MAEENINGKEPEDEIVVFPGAAKLKDEIASLHQKLTELFAERDQLKFVECENIEMEYMAVLGGLEYKAYELHCTMLRLKRKCEMIQAKKNRQEKISVDAIEVSLDREFAEYKKELEKHIDRVNRALERKKGEFLTAEETEELKALYHQIVKALHPDLHPEISDAEMKLFMNGVEAYKNGDLDTLRVIKEMTGDNTGGGCKDGISGLAKEKKRLLNVLEIVNGQIREIKESYPYNLKPVVESKKLTAEKKADLEDTIEKLKEAVESYNCRIDEMLR